jgi:teichuronic acid biosynthesis glycosyltransferase TuaG
MNDLVSIITPVFNSEEYLERTIYSVLNQSYSNWEWILIDDCSIDNSWNIISNYSFTDSRIKVLKNEYNRGSGYTRNKAISHAQGTFIAFLDSDDIWHKDKLTLQIEFMKQNSYSFTHTSYGYINEVDIRIKNTFRVSKKPVDYKHLLKRTEISCLTAIYNCDLIGKFYMSEHRRKQDYALWLNILQSGYKSYPLDIELAYYRQRRNSSTSNKWVLIHKHVLFLKETQGISYIQSLYYTFFWAINGLTRYYF